MIKLDAPDQWGDDELSAFQCLASRNEMSTFAHRPKLIKLLTAMDSTFAAGVQECLRLHEANFGLLFFPNSHNHFRATVRCVTSGQCLAAFPAGRAALETAMSGWYLAKHPEHVDKWKNKPTDKSGARKWSTDFSFSVARQSLEIDNSKLASELQSLYQLSIDYGAHPTKQALETNFRSEKLNNGSNKHTTTYLHEKGELDALGITFLLWSGMAILNLMKHASDEVAINLNLQASITELGVQLLTFFKQAGVTKKPSGSGLAS